MKDCVEKNSRAKDFLAPNLDSLAAELSPISSPTNDATINTDKKKLRLKVVKLLFGMEKMIDVALDAAKETNKKNLGAGCVNIFLRLCSLSTYSKYLSKITQHS